MSRIAVLQCSSGISGDMLLGALVDLGADPVTLEKDLRRLPLPGLSLRVEEVTRGGLRGLKVSPRLSGSGTGFRTLGKIKEALRGGALEPALTREAEKVFERLASAEAAAHGKTPGTVHFHELGSADTVVDVVGVLLAWRLLGIEEGFASPVNLGGGEVATEHGTFTVPAPATARLLEGWTVYSGGEEGERTTPTGAALVTHLCRPSRSVPPVRLERTGAGAGDREFAGRPNVLQVLLGERRDEVEREDLLVLETNLDDLNPQVLGYLTSLLLRAGALECYVTPVVMKKGRPGHLLTALVPPEKEAEIGTVLIRETGTLGYRSFPVGRTKIRRETVEVRTRYGPVRIKTAVLDGMEVRFAPEYEDCRRLAKMSGRPLREIMEEAVRSRSKGPGGR